MRYSASEMFQISELQTNAFWDIRFGAGPLADFADRLEKRITTSELPKPTMKNITAGVHGYEFEIYGIIDYKASVTINFVEPVDAAVAQAIDDWMSRIYNRDNGAQDINGVQIGKHQTIFQDFTLLPLNREDLQTQEFVCKKAALNAFDPGGTLEDGNSPDIYKPTITFMVNWYAWQTTSLAPS